MAILSLSLQSAEITDVPYHAQSLPLLLTLYSDKNHKDINNLGGALPPTGLLLYGRKMKAKTLWSLGAPVHAEEGKSRQCGGEAHACRPAALTLHSLYPSLEFPGQGLWFPLP